MTEKTEEAKAPKRGVGTVIRERLLEGDTNEQALAAVQGEFPDANTTLATVSWYRSDMRKKGEKVQSARDVKKAQKVDNDPLAG